MAIDIIARGLATSILDENGKISSNKMPVMTGIEGLDSFYPLGQLTDSSLIAGKTAEEILLMMLYGVVTPTLTEPSLSIVLSNDIKQPIVGRTSVLKGSLVFNRGKIEPAYGTSGYRAGAPINYIIENNIIQSNNSFYDFEFEINPTNKTLQLSYGIDYAAGEQPLDSVGRPFNNAFPAGSIRKTIIINAVYPLYDSEGLEHDFIWFQDEDNKGQGYLVTVEKESDKDAKRQSFAVSNQTTVIGIKAINPITQQWEWLGGSAPMSLTYFDTKVISGASVGEKNSYILYTNNSTPSGARELKIYIE